MAAALTLAAGAELTIVNAAALQADWLAALAEAEGANGADGAEALALDMSAVTEIDSAGVQLLLALRASLAARGQALRLHAPGGMVLEALRTLGLQASFMPQETTA
jgi:anti-sigma B factor antagonist